MSQAEVLRPSSTTEIVFHRRLYVWSGVFVLLLVLPGFLIGVYRIDPKVPVILPVFFALMWLAILFQIIVIARMRFAERPSVVDGWVGFDYEGEWVWLERDTVLYIQPLSYNPYSQAAALSSLLGRPWNAAVIISVRDGLLPRKYIAVGTDATALIEQAHQFGVTIRKIASGFRF